MEEDSASESLEIPQHAGMACTIDASHRCL